MQSPAGNPCLHAPFYVRLFTGGPLGDGIEYQAAFNFGLEILPRFLTIHYEMRLVAFYDADARGRGFAPADGFCVLPLLFLCLARRPMAAGFFILFHILLILNI